MVEVKKLNFSYSGKPVFKDFNFSPQSRFSVIKGPSGCGKTTLLKLISGNLAPEDPNSIIGADKVAMILQEDALLPWMTGIKNITLMLRLSESKIKGNALYQHVQAFINKNVHEMSYGQRRMVELFRIALLKPRLLCLDEPFNYLDPTKREIFLEYFLESEDFIKTSIIMSTHYNEDVSKFHLETYYFDGTFPIRELLSPIKFKGNE